MKNFFKNLFGKKYPERNDDTKKRMGKVYAGPPTEKTMKCVYAGPDMMKRYKDPDDMREVYAGPPRRDADKAMEGVYMGPPIDKREFIAEEDEPIEEVYMGPEPDTEEPFDPGVPDELEENNKTNDPEGSGDTQNRRNSSEFLMAYAGPSNNGMLKEGPFFQQSQPSMMMVYYGPMGPNNNKTIFMNQVMPASTDTIGTAGTTEAEPDEYKFCPNCGKKLPANTKYCCDCGMDTSKEKVFKKGSDDEPTET